MVGSCKKATKGVKQEAKDSKATASRGGTGQQYWVAVPGTG